MKGRTDTQWHARRTVRCELKEQREVDENVEVAPAIKSVRVGDEGKLSAAFEKREVAFSLGVKDGVEDINSLVGRVHCWHLIRRVPRGKPEAGIESPRPFDRPHTDAADARHEHGDQAPEQQRDKQALHARWCASVRHRAECMLEEASAGWYAAGGYTRHVGTDVHLWTRLSGISKARAPAVMGSLRYRARACMSLLENSSLRGCCS